LAQVHGVSISTARRAVALASAFHGDLEVSVS
jgi:hypothetical protein